MKFLLIVATRGRRDPLFRLMDSLLAQTCRDFTVLLVDQNESDMTDPVMERYSSLLDLRRIETPPRGKSAALNVALELAEQTMDPEIIAIPDDDCWYAPDTLEKVAQTLVEANRYGAVVGREADGTDGKPNSRFDLESGEVSYWNVFRRHIAFTMFMRARAIRGLRFDVTLGVGAQTRWGGGEETDFLLQLMNRRERVYYDYSLVVGHPDWSMGDLNQKAYDKAHGYAMSMGRLLRMYPFPLAITLKYLVRPFLGIVLSLIRLRPKAALYYWSILSGRAGGWYETGVEMGKKKLPRRVTEGEVPKRPMLQKLAGSSLVRNGMSLYAVQFCRKLLPLVSVPYLTRVLGPSGWGKVAFVQAMSEFIVLTLEFGFNLSATREIAQNRHDRRACAEIVAGTVGAQSVLSVFAIAAMLLVAPHLSMIGGDYRLVYAALFYGIFQGIAPLWFFQGVERITLASGIEVVSKVIALVGLFVFVHHTGDEWRVLALQGLAPAVSTVAGLWLAWTTVPFIIPSRRLVTDSLKRGWQMFLLRSSASLYGIGNAFVLGLFAAPANVAFFATAEKISKAVSGLLLPVRDSIYPRLNHLLVHAPEESERLARIGALVMGIGGLLLSVATFFGAPFIIHTLAGQKFEPAIAVLRILSPLPFVIALCDAGGLQYLLPRRRESAVNRVMFIGGIVNVCLASLLASHFTQNGMAWSVILVETGVCVSLLEMVRRSPKNTPPTAPLPSADDPALEPEPINA